MLRARIALKGAALVVMVALAACPAACPPPVMPDGGQPPGEWPLDTVLGDGEVRCGPVAKDTELIGGVLAFGQVGHAWRCHNSRIRFLIQGTERPFGNSSIGGNLIDVDIVRSDEATPGRDAFREHVVAFGVHEVAVESIEVVDDGRSGEQGILRVRGRPTDFTLAPQAALLAQPLEAILETDYILTPDSDVIEIKTTIFNEADDQIYGLLLADFVAFGGENQLLTPTNGFGELGFFQTVPFLASGGAAPGEGASYAYVCPANDPVVIFAESGVTGPMCDDPVVSAEATFSRFLVVGDGTIESVSKRALEIRDLPRGTVTGQVTDSDGQPAAGVYVAALKGGGATEADAWAVNRTRTDEDGRYQLTLAPDEVRVVAYVPGSLRAESDPLFVDDATDATVDLVLPAPGFLEVTTAFLDPAGAARDPLPAKITLEVLADGFLPSEALLDFRAGSATRSVPTTAGQATLEVMPGRYRVWVSRGFEFTRFSVEVDVAAGQTVPVAAQIAHVVDTTGLVGSEFHQHTLLSTDASVPVALKILENAAEGIEVASSTDHDNIVDFGPTVRELGLDPYLTVLVGDEVSFQAIGHFNVYPWDIDPADPYRDVGTRIWWNKNLPTLFADLRRLAGDPIIQLNHARSDGSGVLAAMRFNPVDGTRSDREPPSLPGLPPDIYEQFSTDFDVMEINRDVGSPETFTAEGLMALANDAVSSPGNIPALADYFGLLGAGLVVGATANSDTHYVAEGVGWPRTFLDVGTDDPTAVTPAQVTETLRGQRSMGSHGCLIELRVDGVRRSGLAQAVATGDVGGLSVRVQAPPWVSMSSIEIYMNGRVLPMTLDEDGLGFDALGALITPLPTVAGDEVSRLDAPLAVLGQGDAVVMAVARGGSLGPTAPSSALCWSAPLYIQDGPEWTGWLEETQTIR